MTYLFITDDLAVAKYISDRTAVMYLGKIIEMSSKEALFLNPMHPYTQALLSATPVPNPERKRNAIELVGEVPSAINIPAGCRFHPRCAHRKDECTKTEPQLMEIEKDHLVACHLYRAFLALKIPYALKNKYETYHIFESDICLCKKQLFYRYFLYIFLT